jgi:hypothetical protein
MIPLLEVFSVETSSMSPFAREWSSLGQLRDAFVKEMPGGKRNRAGEPVDDPIVMDSVEDEVETDLMAGLTSRLTAQLSLAPDGDVDAAAITQVDFDAAVADGLQQEEEPSIGSHPTTSYDKMLSLAYGMSHQPSANLRSNIAALAIDTMRESLGKQVAIAETDTRKCLTLKGRWWARLPPSAHGHDRAVRGRLFDFEGQLYMVMVVFMWSYKFWRVVEYADLTREFKLYARRVESSTVNSNSVRAIDPIATGQDVFIELMSKDINSWRELTAAL